LGFVESINTLQRSSLLLLTDQTKEEDDEPPQRLLDNSAQRNANKPSMLPNASIATIGNLVGNKEETIAALDAELWASQWS
jgi:hypothetical protein